MKKKLLPAFFAIIASVLLASCAKNVPANVTETLPTGTTLQSGTFVGSSHSTSGTVKVIQEAGGKKYLVFENFSTDNGPNVRVWLSPNNSGSPNEDLGPLKAVTGNFSYEISSSVNHTTNNRVLIRCIPFSVLFGYAILQ